MDIIKKAYDLIDKPEKEHLLYKLGMDVLKEKNQSPSLIKIKSLFSTENDFQKYRFHHLVKIGAVLENKGLTKMNKATMIGAFKYIAIYDKEHEIESA